VPGAGRPQRISLKLPVSAPALEAAGSASGPDRCCGPWRRVPAVHVSRVGFQIESLYKFNAKFPARMVPRFPGLPQLNGIPRGSRLARAGKGPRPFPGSGRREGGAVIRPQAGAGRLWAAAITPWPARVRKCTPVAPQYRRWPHYGPPVQRTGARRQEVRRGSARAPRLSARAARAADHGVVTPHPGTRSSRRRPPGGLRIPGPRTPRAGASWRRPRRRHLTFAASRPPAPPARPRRIEEAPGRTYGGSCPGSQRETGRGGGCRTASTRCGGPVAEAGSGQAGARIVHDVSGGLA